MFRVIFQDQIQEFERWTDALEAGKALIPQCKRLTEDIRIYLFDDLIWLYSREHKFPKYIGGGTYDRLARLFIQEALEEAASSESGSSEAAPSEASPPETETKGSP
ncbi:MAG: hypothetical protein MUF72_17520 [Elainella sp. Prado103]|jgi:hypothetical protein|nr:hypothetical protein [Elainella sp. Prado103]